MGGIKVSSAIFSALGEARLNLNTRLGNAVPTSVAGRAVEIRTAGGTVIASGSF